MLDVHPIENPFVPQISLSLRAGAIFELRIHLCGLASDVDVVPHTDKLLISGKVQPRVQMRRTDYHTADIHTEAALVWSDQPYGRFGRDVPAHISPGTECVILEKQQEGDDYVIRYNIRNIKHRPPDPFEQLTTTTNCHIDSSNNRPSSFTPHSHGWNSSTDCGVNMQPSRQTYREEYVVSNQESVFASNFTNARVYSADEGISQSFGFMPMQDMGGPAFCNREASMGEYISDNMNIPMVPPASHPFGFEASSVGPHINACPFMEPPPYPPDSTSHFRPDRELSSFTMPMPTSVCPPIGLNTGTSDSSSVVINPPVMHMQSSMPPFMNPVMDTSSSFDNTYCAVHHSQNVFCPDNCVIPGTIPPAPAAWDPPSVLPGAAAAVETSSSQYYGASGGVVDYTVATEPYPVYRAPSNANITSSTSCNPFINPLQHSVVPPFQASISLDASRDISQGIYQDGSISSAIPTMACPTHSVIYSPKSNVFDISGGMRYRAQGVSTLEDVTRTDGHISSTSAVDSFSRSGHMAHSLQEQGTSGFIEVGERGPSYSTHGSGAVISHFPAGTFGGGVHSVIEGSHGSFKGMEHHSRDVSTVEGVHRTDGASRHYEQGISGSIEVGERGSSHSIHGSGAVISSFPIGASGGGEGGGVQHHSRDFSTVEGVTRSDVSSHHEHASSGSIEVVGRGSSHSTHESGTVISHFPAGTFGGGVHPVTGGGHGIFRGEVQHHSRDVSTAEGVTRSDASSHHEQGISGSIGVVGRGSSHSTHESGTVISHFPASTFGGGVHSVIGERHGSSGVVTRVEETHQSSVGAGSVSVPLPEVSSALGGIPTGFPPAPHIPPSRGPLPVRQQEAGAWSYTSQESDSAEIRIGAHETVRQEGTVVRDVPRPKVRFSVPTAQSTSGVAHGSTYISETRDSRSGVPNVGSHTITSGSLPTLSGNEIFESHGRSSAAIIGSQTASSAPSTSIVSQENISSSERGDTLVTQSSSSGIQNTSSGSYRITQPGSAPGRILAESESTRINVSAHETVEQEGAVVRDSSTSEHVRFPVPVIQSTADVKLGSETLDGRYVAPNVGSYPIVPASSSVYFTPNVGSHPIVPTSSSVLGRGETLEIDSTSTSIAVQGTTSSSTSASVVANETTTTSSIGQQETALSSMQSSSSGIQESSTTAVSTGTSLEAHGTLVEAEGHAVSVSGQSIGGSTTLNSETTTELGNSSAVLADMSTSSSQGVSVVNVDASSTTEALGTSESRPSVPGDATSVVIPALTAAAVDVVHNVMEGESFTEALKHSAGSLVRNIEAGVLGVQGASASKEIVESASTSSNQTDSIVEHSSVTHLQDRSGIEATGMSEYGRTEEEQAVGEEERHTLRTGQTVISSAENEEVSQSQTQVGTVEAASQSKDVVTGTITTHITTSAAEHSSATTLETGRSSSQAEAVVKSESYSATGVELGTDIASGIAGSRSANAAAISDLGSSTEQTSGAIVSVNEGISSGHSVHETTTVASTTGKTTESKIESSTDVTVQSEATVMESSTVGSSSQSSRDVEVKSTAAEVTAGTLAVDTIATSSGETSTTFAADISVSEQTQSQSQSQINLVRDEVVTGSRVEGNEASGAQSSAPVDSNIVPVPAPSNPTVALQTSTRQDVVLETQSNISNLSASAQSVIGQTQSHEETAESLSLGRGVSTLIEENLASSSSREDAHTGVMETYQTGTMQTSSTIEVSAEVTPRQQEKQPHIPSIVFLEPSSPVDVVVSVPTSGSSSSKTVTATQSVDEQSTTTRVEEVTTSASSGKLVSSSAELKEIEAQASVRVMPALTSSPAILKDALYTPASISSPSQYDPPPAYSPARSNTLFGQSTVTNLERDINVSTNTQVQVERFSSSRSHSDRVEHETESSLTAEEKSTTSSSTTVKGTQIEEASSPVPVVSSGISLRQRPSFLRGESSFSDYVNIYPEESTDREVETSSDSSNSSVVRVRNAEARSTKASKSHNTEEPSSYLDISVRERFQGGIQQIEEQVVRQTETLVSTVRVDAGRTAVVSSTQGSASSESAEKSENGARSFIDIVQEEQTGHYESAAAENSNKKIDITVGETAGSTSKSFSLETIHEDTRPEEASDNHTDLYSSRKASSGSIESTHSYLETGFLQHLHQDAAYTRSDSELRSKSTEDQKTAASHELHSKRDLNDSIELDYVDVRIDRSSSSESISNDTSQTETQVATHSSSNLPSQAVTDTVVTSSLQTNDEGNLIQSESVDTDSSKNVVVTRVCDATATSNVSSTVSESPLESAKRTSDVNVTSWQDVSSSIASQEIAGTQVIQIGLDGTQSLPVGVPVTLTETSTAIITFPELQRTPQTAAESQGRSENTETSIVTSSTYQSSRDAHSEVVATTLSASDDLHEHSTQSESITESSTLKVREDELSTSAVVREATSTISESVTPSGGPDESSDGHFTLSSMDRTNVELTSASLPAMEFAAISSDVKQEAIGVTATSDVREIEGKTESTMLAVSQQTEHGTLALNSDQSTNAQFLVSASNVDTNSFTTFQTAASEQLSSDREAHTVVASEISVSHEDTTGQDISFIHTAGEQVLGSQALKGVPVKEGTSQEFKRYDSETSIQQTQISAQGSRSETTEVTTERITPVSTEEQHMTETAAEEIHFDVSEGHLNFTEETRSKLDGSTSIIGVVHETETTAEAFDTTIQHDVEFVKTLESTGNLTETISKVSDNPTESQNQTDTQDQVTELTTTSFENSVLVTKHSLSEADIQDTLRTSHASTIAETTAEAVDTPVAASTAQITVSEAPHSCVVSNSATSISKEITESTDTQDTIDTKTIEQTGESSTLVTAAEMHSTATSMIREEGTQHFAPIEPTVAIIDVQTVQTEASQQAISTIHSVSEMQESQHVSDIVHTDLIPSNNAESYGPQTRTYGSESAIDISTKSLNVQTETVTQEGSQSFTFASGSMHDTMEDSTTSVGTHPITTERTYTGASEESTTNWFIRIADSTSEAGKIDVIIPSVQEVQDSGDSAVEVSVQESEVEVANSSMDNLPFTFLESKPEVSLSHQEDSREEDRMMVPSRRDSFVTTSEDSNETTVRPFDPTPSGTPIRKFLSFQSPSKSTLAEAKVTVTGSLVPLAASSDKVTTRSESATSQESSTAESSLILATHGEEEVYTSFEHTNDSRRNFAPTAEEVPNIDVEMDSPVDFHDDETALTIDVQTVTGYSDSRPVSFYSIDDRTVNLYTPTDDGDSASTVFHSGSEGTPASRTMTSTAEDFYSATYSEMGDAFISSPSITEHQTAVSPETSPPVLFTPAPTFAFDQRSSEAHKTVETYNSSITKQETKTVNTQEMSFARNESGSGWGMFDPTAAFNFVKSGGTGFTGKKKTNDFVPMKKF